ncbi:hypothetical protein B0H10DRAFT_2037579 [Mycena sp. CBHHK59/15]|nr:hypothetical protein B0H10DRAFT_2037579 [Mycena sp. CBHHK59/15]
MAWGGFQNLKSTSSPSPFKFHSQRHHGWDCSSNAVVAAEPALITVVAPFGSDPTPLTAEVLGVDSQGRTTYALQQNEMQGDSTLALITGTLVEGSDYISYTFSHTSASEMIVVGVNCALSGRNGLGFQLAGGHGDGVVGPRRRVDAAPSGSAPTSQPTTKPKNSSQRTSASIFGTLIGLSLAYQLV